MAYFVTGATGFIGKRLVERLLERDGDIYVLAREQSVDKVRALWPDARVKPVVGDLTQPLLGVDPAAVQGVEHFFHLAALYDMTATAEANDLANV
jgi:nucleoside-diphosphate-sugar epimerase